VRIRKNNLIQFVNLVNECCEVMPDDHVADWLLTPNKDLDMQMPIDLSDTEKGMNKVLRLLYFIEIGEADL
jgi:uncharacterized protein (DUF2384 family)|tara:strand:- start:472 stop:684 length:213 start_codon:yes stop_codon:yes gene_type:complete